MAWQDRAACRGADVAVFVRADGGCYPAEALTFCRRCPVRVECLEDCLASKGRLRLGVWGGTLEQDRRAPNRERARLYAREGRPEWQPGPARKTGRPRVHGTIGRYRAGCRCEPCVTAARATWRRSRRAYVARKRAEREQGRAA